MIRCDDCKRTLASSEIAFRWFNGDFKRSGLRRRSNTCRRCTPNSALAQAKVMTCVGCGRRVGLTHMAPNLAGRDWYCNWQCRCSALAAKTRQNKKCLQCGAALDCKRNDKLYCSPACRQKFYRNRSKQAKCDEIHS
jgi:hypothetical protein